MKVKRILSVVLALCLCAGLWIPSTTLAAEFPDITDPQVAEAAGLLRQLGVLNGDEKGNFNPQSPLTRAQFCKMAIELRGEGDKAAAMMSYTFFKDVKGDHWARGYINYASRITVGESERLVMGVGDGNFLPDDTIRFAEAVTMTLRLLGYSREAVASGSLWYEGYLTTAAAIGLTKDIDCAWDAPVTRADAARLFYNLLFVKPLGGGSTFFEALGGSRVEKVLVLDTDATAADGAPALTVATDGGLMTCKTGSFSPDPALVGSTVNLMLDKDSRIIALETLSTPSRREITVAMVGSDHILTQSGERLVLPSTLTVYEGTKAAAYGDVAAALPAGSRLTLCSNAAGQLEFAFLTRAGSVTGQGTSRTVKLAVAEANYLRTDDERIAVSTDTPLYLNGEKTTYGAVYMDLPTGTDLTLSYSAAGALEYIFISERVSASNQVAARLTAVYEDAWPSPRTPLTVHVLGKDLTVLDSAVEELAGFALGDQVTFLLTWNGKVAGVVKPERNASTLVGVVTAGDGETASVTPVLDLKDASGAAITFSLPVTSSAENLVGELVTLSSYRKGTMTLSRTSSAVSGALNVEQGTLGDTPLAGQVFLYERTGGGMAQPITWDQVTIPTVPAGKIAYAGVNEQGQVNVIVLSDVTGDGYAYGYLKARTETVEVPATGDFAASSYDKYYIDATTAAGTAEYRTRFRAGEFNRSTPGGVVTKADGWAATVTLTEITKVSRSAFRMDDMTVTLGGVVYPIAGNVQCYNSTTGTWFASGKDGVNAARAYSNSLTLYYDKSPAEGGKVRLIVVK